ncbi:anti-sigma factor [Hoyosella rhizosphaerae]|uniref:Regulator of SigK n=1 Tax=Hoyosella rhizosphaerae TaxID=1755582 RepID=A0A916UI13_9ACTN|nr:anti-sigma factor [Hoyosella rhizosphaerae]MBN4928138.1 anti-sigma factor [Hoyosella rhizosphaerae]GGC72700.1 hypothetical protein GCM10011410_27200 [Hoyosella rhizosphaerae]
MRIDFHSLTGAYVLNSLPAFERERFEVHLKRCPMCAHEVAELREAAARIGAAASMTPPPELKDRVMAEVAQTRQRPPEVSADRGRRSWLPAASAVVAAASMVVAIGLGIQLGQVNQDLNDQTQAREQLALQYERFANLVTAGDAELVVTSIEGGGTASAVVAKSHNSALFVTHDLAPLPEHLTYQLWVLGPDGTHSAGLLSPAAGTASEALLAEGVSDDTQLALTVEPAGGSPSGTTSPVVILPLQ